MYVPQADFSQIIKYTPLVNIDFLIRNSDGKFLLGYRTNRPAIDYWFVPGGRIRKGETFKTAFDRISKDELGISFQITEGQFMGVYEHFYKDNTFNEPDFGTHYIVLAYRININLKLTNFPNEQHETFRWFSKPELLYDKKVHKYTKDYFYQL